MDWTGWSALSPTEQFAAICGASGALGVSMTLRTLFGGLQLRREQRRKAKSKARKRRR